MPSFTSHNQWGSFRWSPGRRDRLHKPPAVLLVTSVQLLLLCVAGYFLSPVVQKATQCRGSFSHYMQAKMRFPTFADSTGLTGWKKLACAPKDKSLRQVSRFPVRTLEWSCWKKIFFFFFYIDCRVHTQSGDFLRPEPSDVMHYSAGNTTTYRDPYGIQ